MTPEAARSPWPVVLGCLGACLIASAAAWLAVRHDCTHPHLPESAINRDEPLGIYCHRVREAGYAVLWALPTIVLSPAALIFRRNARLLVAITVVLILGLVVAVALSQSLSNGNFNI